MYRPDYTFRIVSTMQQSADDSEGFNGAALMEYCNYCLAFYAHYGGVDNASPLTLQEYFDERAEIAFYSEDVPVDDGQRDASTRAGDTHLPEDRSAPTDAHEAVVATDTGPVTAAHRARPRWKRGSLQAPSADL